MDKEYRDSYLDGYVKGLIAVQIRALRGKFGLSQVEFAQKMRMTQSAVSRLENAEYGRVTVNTLLKVATENNVGINIRFTDYMSVVHADLTPSALAVDDVFESYKKLQQIASSDVPTANVEAANTSAIFILIRNNVSVASPEINNRLGVVLWQNPLPIQQSLEFSSLLDFPAFETLNIERFTQT